MMRTIITILIKIILFFLVVTFFIFLPFGFIPLLNVISDRLGNNWIAYYSSIIGSSLAAFSALAVLMGQNRMEKKRELETLKLYYDITHNYFSNYVKNNLMRFQEEVAKEIRRTQTKISDRDLEKDFINLSNQPLTLDININKLLSLRSYGILSEKEFDTIQDIIWDITRFNQTIESYYEDKRIYFETIAQSNLTLKTPTNLISFLDNMKLYWIIEIGNIEPLIDNIYKKIVILDTERSKK